MPSAKSKIIIGLTAPIEIISNGHSKKIKAKVDTGATKSSIDSNLVKELNLGPIIKSKIVRNAHGSIMRPIIEVELELAGRKIKTEFTVADRSHMNYKVLLGVNILENNFLVDPSMK